MEVPQETTILQVCLKRTSPKSGARDLLEAGHDPVKLLPKDILQVPARMLFRKR